MQWLVTANSLTVLVIYSMAFLVCARLKASAAILSSGRRFCCFCVFMNLSVFSFITIWQSAVSSHLCWLPTDFWKWWQVHRWSTCRACLVKLHPCFLDNHIGIWYGTLLIFLVQSALLNLVSMQMSSVPTSFMANFQVSLSVQRSCFF